MAQFQFDRATTRLLVQGALLLTFVVVIFFMIRKGFSKGYKASELPDAGQGLTYTDSAGKTRRYNPSPLADTLHRIINLDPSWYALYDIDVTDLETALRELNSLPTADMKYAVIDTYNNAYRDKFGTLEEGLTSASYWTTDPTYRDKTLMLIRSRQQYLT